MHLCWLQCQENTFPAEGWEVGRWGGSRARGGWVLRLGSSGQGGRQSSTVLLMQLSCLEGLVQVPACLCFQHILLNTIACVCLIIRGMPIVHWNSKMFRNAQMWVQNKKGGTKVWHCCGECWKIPWAQGKTGQARRTEGPLWLCTQKELLRLEKMWEERRFTVFCSVSVFFLFSQSLLLITSEDRKLG